MSEIPFPTVVAGLSIIVQILAVGALWGAMSSKMTRLEKDVDWLRAIVIEALAHRKEKG